MFKKIMITTLLVGISGLSLAASNRPSGYTTICKIDQTCTVSGSTNVAFGASGKFVYKVLSGSFSCSVSTFGSDPIPSKSVKECSISKSGSGSGGTTSSTPPTNSSSSSSGSTNTGGSSECKAGATISNKTVDCGGKTIGLSCPGDGEGQPAVITLKNATIKNVRIAANGGADGIHCDSGTCRAENVVWEDICEDAASLLSSGKKLTISGGSAYNSTSGPGGKPDKIFQHNSKNSTFEITGNFTAKGTNGKLYRSCGNCSSNGGPRYVNINNVTIDGSIGSIAGVNGNFGDVATIRNLKIKGYKSGSPKVCEEYKGVQKGSSSTKIGEKWNTSACNVSKSDVKAF